MKTKLALVFLLMLGAWTCPAPTIPNSATTNLEPALISFIQAHSGSGSGITNNQTGVTLSGTFNGNGAGMTNLAATNLVGTLPDARLSTNVLVSGTLPIIINAPITHSNTPPFMQFRGFGNTNFFDINSDSPFNIFIGLNSGEANIASSVGGASGTANTYLGYQSGQFNVSGKYNLGLGTHSLNANTNGNFNVALGPNAMLVKQTGDNNVGVGAYALSTAIAYTGNTAVGDGAMQSESGSYNTGIGANVLAGASGQYNFAAGRGALQGIGPGDGNSVSGFASFQTVTNANYNSGVGFYAGQDQITGDHNQIYGAYCSLPNLSGSRQLNIGCLIFGDTLYNGGVSSSSPVAGHVGIAALPTTSTLTVGGAVTANGGFVLPQLTAIPTNSIPASSSGNTNAVLLNLTNTIGGGGYFLVSTNFNAAGSFLLQKITTTDTVWP